MKDMPRLPRAEYEPGLYHVFARGNRKQADLSRWTTIAVDTSRRSAA